ncbi:uracil-DNA glycosylase [Chitinimonas sp.]|uniref:uracil-DNA glycosylase n=1 Tax=Chitinimonas sp. TaxID=1934313 RepID=UPI002F93B23B
MNAARRELILEELGLQPQWVRRSVLNELAAANEAAAPAVVPAVAEPVAEAHRSAVPVADTPTPVAQESAAQPASQRRPSPAQAALMHADAPAQRSDTAAPANVEQDPELRRRAASIAQLDWEALQGSVAACTACGLCKSRNRTVFGVGNPEADWLVVGEAPGADEDRQGEPFVGQAGKLLDSMLDAVGRKRQENVFILNTLKCRPPQNRNPTPEELALCAPYLHRQVELIKPKVIFAVGRFAVQTLLGREASIASLRGRLHDYRGIPVVVSYHPAYLLRNLPDKIKAWQDLLLARDTLAGRQDS